MTFKKGFTKIALTVIAVDRKHNISKHIGKIKTEHKGSVFYGDGLGTNPISFFRKAHHRILLNQSLHLEVSDKVIHLDGERSLVRTQSESYEKMLIQSHS